MDIVPNSTPLIALSRLHTIEILQQLFGTISIPLEVYDEAVTRGGTLYGAREVSDAPWILVIPVRNMTAAEALCVHLDRGEAEAIVLAREKDALLLIDDKEGRNAALSLGPPITGTMGILLLASQEGMINWKKELDSLIASGFRISEREYHNILERAG